MAGAPPQCKLVASSPGNLQTTTLTFYDAAGQVQYTVDARGAVTQNQYDGAGRRTNVLVYTAYAFAPTSTGTPNPTGAYQSTSYTYDANGNQVTVTDAAGHTTTSVYDNANRVIEVDSPSTSGGTLARKMYYDGLGRKLQETDEAGVSTAYTYDFRGLLLSVTLAAGTAQPVTTVYSYDELGNETNQVDAAGHTTVFRYDALGRRTGRTLPGGQSEGSYYDPLTGNLIYQTNFNGVVITNLYDVANRLTNSASVNGYRVSYRYNITNGWRTNLVDPSGTTVWRYNAVGQLTNKVVAWANGPVAMLNYGYDALGSLTNLWSGTANGVTNAYQYDLLGRLTNVLANGSAAAGYGFDKVGNLQTLRYGNGVTNGYQYDAQNRLTNQVWKLNNTAVAGFAYTLGPTGNRTNLVETVATASRTYTWAYDYLYRLTGETISGAGTVNYGYDAVGNRTNRTSSISQLTNAVSAYTANDWLGSDSYDANGSTTASSGNSYQYDALNHLTNANNGTVLMTYDGDGNRASKKVGGTTTYYLLDDRNPSGYVQVLEEWTVTSTATNLARVYNYGLALISQRVPNASTNYFIYDGHGSTRALMDSGGNVVNTFAYDAYGTLIASNGLPQTAYLYCGQQYDSDLGMYLNRARYLNVGTGRFWTMDSYEGDKEEPLSLHKYLYGGNDPVDNDDPSGNDFELGGLLGAIDIGGMLAQIYNPVSSKALASVKTPLRDWPKNRSLRLLVAAIFAESTSGNGSEDAVEKVGIGATLYNDVFFAKLPPGSKQKRNYNAASFGNGTIVGALKIAFKPSYLKKRWNLVAGPLDLKPQTTLDSVLIAGDRIHYDLSVDAANTITYPMNVSQLSNERPIGFNKAPDSPPSPDRDHKIGHAGLTTFYGFDKGREYQ